MTEDQVLVHRAYRRFWRHLCLLCFILIDTRPNYLSGVAAMGNRGMGGSTGPRQGIGVICIRWEGA
jgi:hypothetical protein